MLPSSQRERRVSRLNRTGNNKTGWARRLTALLITACLVMAMALPVYAEVDLLPDAPDEVELLEDEPGTASGEDTAPPEQNAATPEPEQSAEPEQPAPTETPEPTVEPTPTPEPAATATATPVPTVTPTVTPTATPEPTEQPQKMYAAKSVDDVQAVSEQEAADGFTVYFVVPDTMPSNNNNTVTVLPSDAIRLNVKTKATSGNEWWHWHAMEPTGRETEDGHKIYAVKNCKDIKGDNFQEIQFQLYKDSTWKDWKGQITLNNNLGPISDFNNKMYDPTTNNGEWTDGSILTSYTYYAGEPIKFENRSTADLTNVKANFYIPDENGNLKPVDGGSEAKPVVKGECVVFTIPDVECSYVRFTWDEDGEEKSSKFYNFYNESVSDDKESFMYSETSNCFIYTGTDNVRWGIENSFCIYYDATFSKLPTTGTGNTDGDYSIPKAKQSTVYYGLKGNGQENKYGTMSRIKNTDYYVADVPDGYTQIVFASYPLSDNSSLATCGDSTNWETIPENYTEPCFYADTNDDAVYRKGQRGGYWAPKGTLRDAETWKNRDAETGKETPIVDIASVPFTEEANTKYVTSTLYDYYTDYELNGKNRDEYKYNGYKDASHRNWVTFREFDQALSDYYEKAEAQYPIYTGHFQPAGGPEFSQIADTLKLFGYKDNFNRFMAINNSQRNEDNTNTSELINYAYQGLVADTTSTGKATGEPLLKGTKTVEPHFNKDFLSGENSKNAKLGEVYKNVKFPFTKKQNLFGNEEGVDYWYFDSKDTTLYLKQDSGHNSDSEYFLQKSTDKRDRSLNVDVSSNSKNQYGYFPFNETADPHVASTYNYGFGTKLQMDFTLTDDGKVETNKIVNGQKVKTSIKFFFSGDDDVWVFIDGQLALDVGGAHGEVSGLLEFGETEENGKKKNSVTAYVSKVKKGGTSESDQNGSPVKTVKYNGEDINFSAKGTTLTFDKGQKHTLTMYYMERGMWGSNMAVAFNFPDNNELQVQKKVDLTNVTDQEFKDCFKKQKIFNFTIQNQATHYGPKDAVGSDPSGFQKVDLTADGNIIAPATPDKEDEYIFRLDPNPLPNSGPDGERVLHWYARYTDTQPVSKARKQRYGILTLKDPINIENMRFLTFQVYVDSNDGGELSLNNLYLELLDNQNLLDPPKSPGQKGSLGTTGINGATYGSVELKTGTWVTVKLDLHKMKEQDGFNGKVQTIRVGDNYSRNIYFRNFTFIPKAVPTEMTGFTTDQEKIPDYGSATTGQLKNAENAQYTSNMDTDTQLVDEDGRFVLEDGEIVTFSDQFRRGSYISLKEELNENLYDTTWTVYENGQKVTSMSKGDSVSLPSTIPSLDGQKGSGPNDGRTEKKGAEEQNKYDGNKPSADTIVFRSYKDPDEKSSTLTKLKVQYVNTVKTGGLTIKKQAAEGEKLTGTYTFKVTFNDVGGAGLEEKPIEKTVTINGENTGTITGIPVGTRYTIEEVKTSDDSRLQRVTVPLDCHSAHEINNNTMVEGVIEASEDPKLTAIFTNTKRTLINIEFDKLWKDANGKDISTTDQPDKIYIQLQRRLATSQNDADWTPVNYPTANSPDYVTIKYGESRWQFTFSGLDQYQINTDNNNHIDYVYRIVEGTLGDEGSFNPAVVTQAGETITIGGKTYGVTVKAEATPNSETDSTGSSTGNTATATDGTISGGSGKIVLTNKLQNPKFVLDIIKKDAEKDKNDKDDKDVPLSDVEFKLEKLVETTTGGEPQVDPNYQFDNENTGSITATTKGDGKITGVFTNLEPGTYRLTETKAHPGYNLLAQPIKIQFTQDGKCYIDGQAIKDENKFKPGANNTYTMTLTVLNRKTPELPHTGADAPSLWLLIGMPLAVAGLLIFTFRYNRKGGRRH